MTGYYESIPSSYFVMITEGKTVKAYPIESWFKFGALTLQNQPTSENVLKILQKNIN